jgi:PAS domain-containing protein
MTTTSQRQIEAAVLDAHPVPTLVTDGDLQILMANAAARTMLGAREGVRLGEALSCTDAQSPGGCGEGPRCGSCAFLRAVQRALAGEAVRERGFVLREAGGDLHLLARAGPFVHGGGGLAILALDDANALLADPGVTSVCEGCGRVRDEEGGWHPLHRYLADRLGIEAPGPLCDRCAAGGHH